MHNKNTNTRLSLPIILLLSFLISCSGDTDPTESRDSTVNSNSLLAIHTGDIPQWLVDNSTVVKQVIPGVWVAHINDFSGLIDISGITSSSAESFRVIGSDINEPHVVLLSNNYGWDRGVTASTNLENAESIATLYGFDFFDQIQINGTDRFVFLGRRKAPSPLRTSHLREGDQNHSISTTGHWILEVDPSTRNIHIPGLMRVGTFGFSQYQHWAESPGSGNQSRQQIAGINGVISAIPVQKTHYSTPVVPYLNFHIGDRCYDEQYPDLHAKINTEDVWDQGFTGKGVHIGIVDAYFQYPRNDLGYNSCASSHLVDDLNDSVTYQYPFESEYCGVSLSVGSNNSVIKSTSPSDYYTCFSSYGGPIHHGTMCASTAAGAYNNDSTTSLSCGAQRGDCGVGVAFDSEPCPIAVGIDLNNIFATASAFHHMTNPTFIGFAGPFAIFDYIDIYNASFGNEDNYPIEESSALVDAALRNGSEDGRSGRGAIYVVAAGNGGLRDHVNANPLARPKETIVVSAHSAGTAERGSAVMLSAPGQFLVAKSNPSSCGWFEDDYLNNPTGLPTDPSIKPPNGYSSAAAPTVAGVVALMLEANPSLSWRAVQQILIRTADRSILDSGTVFQNEGGFEFSNLRYGAGLVDASEAIDSAKTTILWSYYDALDETYLYPVPDTNQFPSFIPIQNNPLDPTDWSGSAVVEMFVPSSDNGMVIESVELEVKIAGNRSDFSNSEYTSCVEVLLESPSGTQSDVYSRHESIIVSPGGGSDLPNAYLQQYGTLFQGKSLWHWGERPAGTWKVKVRIANNSDYSPNSQLLFEGSSLSKIINLF